MSYLGAFCSQWIQTHSDSHPSQPKICQMKGPFHKTVSVNYGNSLNDGDQMPVSYTAKVR